MLSDALGLPGTSLRCAAPHVIVEKTQGKQRVAKLSSVLSV